MLNIHVIYISLVKFHLSCVSFKINLNNACGSIDSYNIFIDIANIIIFISFFQNIRNFNCTTKYIKMGYLK